MVKQHMYNRDLQQPSIAARVVANFATMCSEFFSNIKLNV